LPHSLQGLWWKQEANVSGFVTLTNASTQPTEATIQVSDAAGNAIGQHSVTVSSHGTKLVTMPELQGANASEGGISVAYTGPADALILNGGLEDQAVGYSAMIPFAAPPALSTKPSTESYAELGLMSGAADPMMSFPAGTTFAPYSIMRNIADQPIRVSPTLWWMEAGTPRSAPLHSLTVSPGQTQSLNMPALLASASLNNFNGSMNLILDVQGPARGLLLTSGSVDQKNTYVFEVRPVGVGESNAKSLGYWSIGNGDDTMVTLWNAADEAQDLVFTLFFTGGHYNFPIHLGPRATNTFNISEIVHSQIPDAEGNVVPASIHEGSARISGPHDPVEHILVGMAAGVYNVVKATCAVICYNCNGTVAFETIDPNPLTVRVIQTATAQFIVGFTNGGQYDYTSLSTWTTSNTGIATVQSAGVIKGLAGGNFTTTALGPKETENSVCCSDTGTCPCTQVPTVGTSPGPAGDDTPMVSGIYPSDWDAGTNTTGVTFTGQNFGTNPPTLNFSPPSGISYGLVTYNDTQIVANVAVASGVPNEAVSVTVTNNGYGGSGFTPAPGQSAQVLRSRRTFTRL
jgi:hypothetical protein